MQHAIIIPHRNRHSTLVRCIASLRRSAEVCGIDDWVAIVVNSGDIPVNLGDHVSVVVDSSYMPVFCKPRLQNLGIKCAGNADVFSFLDADAIVGHQWMSQVSRCIDDPTITKLCYRVRWLADCEEPNWSLYNAKAMRPHDGLEVDVYPLAHEGYGRPEHNALVPGPIFGNSQFSISRESLGETRFNENYIGRGYEDLWMNRELWMRNPDAYCAEIVTDGPHAIFHIKNSVGGPDWFVQSLNADNARRYRESWRGMDKLLPIA